MPGSAMQVWTLILKGLAIRMLRPCPRCEAQADQPHKDGCDVENDVLMLLAYDGVRVDGYLLARILEDPMLGRVADVAHVYARPGKRGFLGVFNEVSEAWARQRQATMLTALTARESRAYQVWMASFGYTPIAVMYGKTVEAEGSGETATS